MPLGNNWMCSSSESLLARCVPDLQFEGLAFKLDDSDFEVHSDGGGVALCVRVVSESKKEA